MYSNQQPQQKTNPLSNNKLSVNIHAPRFDMRKDSEDVQLVESLTSKLVLLTKDIS
jgi:hypothetical protein